MARKIANGTIIVTDYPAHLQTRRLQVTRYDHAWSWLLALLLLFGTAVFILSMIWLSNHMHVTEITREVIVEELGDGEGGGDGRPTGGTQLESPDNSSEPIPVTDTPMTDLQETLTAVTETVVEQVAMLDDPSLQPPKAKGDYGTGGGSGGGSGPGRGLGHGKGKAGRPQRRDLKFDKGNTIETYGKQLDFFGIELGVTAPGDKMIYLSKFSSGIPTRREGPRTDSRYYFAKGPDDGTRPADLEFFRRAKVEIPNNGLIYMFLPPKVDQDLLQLEKSFQNKSLAEIKKTRFGVLTDGSGYKFNVISQMLK